jgi:calcineurin-like phosphoesterase family protein
MRNFDLEAFFESVDNELMIVDRNRPVIMNHYPLMTFPRKSWLVYGHIHNDKPASYWPVLKTYEHALNASVEVNGYMPVTLDELITNNAMWRSDEA